MKKRLAGLLALCLTLSLSVLPASALELEDAKTLLRENYVDGVPEEVLALDSLDAILEALGDPYTVYYSAEEYQSFLSSVNGESVVGIGVSVQNAFDNGFQILSILPDSPALEAGLEAGGVTWMSHGDYMERVPDGFRNTAHTAVCPNAAIADESRGFYGVQFHPEVNHTEHGTDMIRNFLYGACKAAGSWSMGSYKDEAIAGIREKIGGGKVLLALSGGVDSSVAAALLSEAVGDKLTAVFVDHGLLRKGEADEVERVFSDRELNFVRVDARDRFLIKLAGVSEPERKRRIIGEEFIRVFEAEAKKIGAVDFLAQGTIYPDVIESGAGDAAVIKSHHNVGGLPDYVDFREIIEPLRMLFKDEVRQLGRELGLPESLVMRQPFPGPGLAIRVIGDVTEDKLSSLREADAIFREELAASGLPKLPDQYFAVLTDTRSVGVMGDERTYDYTLALRAVETSDFMTADWFHLPWELLDRVSTRIVNEVGGINRVVYDITSKPPATIEWE